MDEVLLDNDLHTSAKQKERRDEGVDLRRPDEHSPYAPCFLLFSSVHFGRVLRRLSAHVQHREGSAGDHPEDHQNAELVEEVPEVGVVGGTL